MNPSLLMVVLLLACRPAAESAVVATVSDAVPTVVSVRWSGDSATIAWVEYGPTEDLGLTTPIPTLPVVDHSTPLMGLPAYSDVYYRTVEQVDGVEQVSAVEMIQTGGFAAEVPEVAGYSGEPVVGWLLAPVVGATFGPVMFDAGGEVVWFVAEDANLKSLRAVMSVDGLSILHNAIDAQDGERSLLIWTAFDGRTTRRVMVPGMTHDFVELDDGTVGTFVLDTREVAGVAYTGTTLVEIGLDDTQTQVWSTWDSFDPAATGGDADPLDWTHANAIDYDPDDDAWLVGSRNFSTIFQVDRATGALNWAFGDVGADVVVDAPGDRFVRQHQFDRIDDETLLVFDNDGGGGRTTRVAEYRMDVPGGSAELVGSIDFDPTWNAALGDAWRDDDGVTSVILSMLGELRRIDPDGQTIGQLNLPLGYGLGYGQALGTPYGD